MLQNNYSLVLNTKKLPLDSSGFLRYFESYLADLLLDLEAPVLEFANHVMLSSGKRIRPLLCFHCGSNHKNVTPDLLKASAILELVHVATLVHDDIIDQSDLRRGISTLHSFAGEHTSILLGDALFSFALELATDFSTTKICKIVSKATRLTCTGEILQTSSRGDFSISRSNYNRFIQYKTGELFKASCQLGAFLGDHSEKDIETVGEFGLELGICYQIYDDLVDAFSSTTILSKPTGADTESGKLTLPLLLLLEKSSPGEKKLLLDVLDNNIVASNKELFVTLFKKYSILQCCKDEFHTNFAKINVLAGSVSDKALARNLVSFLSFFTSKISALSTLDTSNFLAK
jgi:octaprenyl-diphosphate synthase